MLDCFEEKIAGAAMMPRDMEKAMAKRLTAEQLEQREQEREQARQAEIAKKVGLFRVRIDDERAKTVYSDHAAFETQDKAGIALYEMVREYKRTGEQLRKHIERMQERMADAVKRLDVGESPTWYSTMLGDLPADIEQAATKLATLAGAITRLAWATGWYVPQVQPQRDRENRERMLQLRVVRECASPHCKTERHDIMECGYPQPDGTEEVWRVYVGDQVLRGRDIPSIGVGEEPMVYRSEILAWVAAARLVGERLD